MANLYKFPFIFNSNFTLKYSEKSISIPFKISNSVQKMNDAVIPGLYCSIFYNIITVSLPFGIPKPYTILRSDAILILVSEI